MIVATHLKGGRTAICRANVLSSLLALFMLCVSFGTCRAQEPPASDDAPPPLKQLSKDEKQLLVSETEVKARTSLALDLMNKRLENAETLNSKRQFEEMFKQLGGFSALMDDALKFLTNQDKGKARVLNNFKKLDIGLRAFMPRLETIRRDLPSPFEPYVRLLIKTISETREKALDPMFGNTVVPNH
jgi:hypothetical protein